MVKDHVILGSQAQVTISLPLVPSHRPLSQDGGPCARVAAGFLPDAEVAPWVWGEGSQKAEETTSVGPSFGGVFLMASLRVLDPRTLSTVNSALFSPVSPER